MSMVRISVIMPVFNTAIYLKKSIDSLLNQSFTDFELICVDDNSEDNSLEILMQYQQKDSRIIIKKHEMNRGAANTRNDGLKIARGEYIIFVDSDDFFYQNMLEVAYRDASIYNADVVIFGSETSWKKTGYQFGLIDDLKKKCVFLPKARHVPWDKLVRRELLVNAKIEFQNIPTNNDIFYSYSVLLFASRIIVSDKILLFYNEERSGSLSEQRNKRNNGTIEALYEVFTFSVKNKLKAELFNVYLNILLDQAQLYLLDSKYSLAMRRNSLNLFMSYTDLMNELECCTNNNILYPHNKLFWLDVSEGKDIWNNKYDFYLFKSIKALVSDKKRQSKRVALWGCGENGKKVIDIIGNMILDFVIDENPSLHGKKYRAQRKRRKDYMTPLFSPLSFCVDFSQQTPLAR